MLLSKAEQKQNESKSTLALRKGLLHLRSLSLERVTRRTIGLKSKLSRHRHKIEGLERKRKLDPENLPCLFSNNQWEEQWSYISAVSFELHRLTCLKVDFPACWFFPFIQNYEKTKQKRENSQRLTEILLPLMQQWQSCGCVTSISKKKKKSERTVAWNSSISTQWIHKLYLRYFKPTIMHI